MGDVIDSPSHGFDYTQSLAGPSGVPALGLEDVARRLWQAIEPDPAVIPDDTQREHIRAQAEAVFALLATRMLPLQRQLEETRIRLGVTQVELASAVRTLNRDKGSS